MRRTGMIMLLATLLAAGCGSPEQAWQLAEREDTNEAYLQFLAKYPDGEYAERARARMDALRELRAWERAQFRDRLANYERFLDSYPASEFAPAARERIAALERDAAWAAASEDPERATLEAFLARYPDAPQADDARELLAAMAPPPPPPKPLERAGDFRVQLGAFRSAAGAETELRRLVGRYQDILLGPVRLESPTETGGRRFLLKTVPMSWAEAQTACGRLQAAGQNCFVVNR